MEAGEDRQPDAPGTPPDGEPTTLESLRASVAQLDRKLGTRFYALGAATVLALAAGIVGIVLVLGVKEDSATTSDLDELREEVSGVEESASEAAQDEVSAIGDRVSQLESQIQSLRSDQTSTDQEISVLQDDIADLRDDISALESQPPADSGGDSGGGTGGAGN
jgi:septal ring factor EnvC (AmiA/AmiB activator)